MDEKKYYIYAHIRLDNNSVFYIGKGCGNRAYIKSNRSEFWKRIVNKHGYRIEFLETCLSQEEAYSREITFIASYKSTGGCEANFTIGGDGVRIEKRWWGDKISKSMKGKKKPTGVKNKSFKDLIDKETLFNLYVTKGLNTIEISELVGLSVPTIASRLELYGIEKRAAGRTKIKIQCINDGKVFDSINDAAKFYGLFRENIKKVIEGKYKHTGNKKFIKL